MGPDWHWACLLTPRFLTELLHQRDRQGRAKCGHLWSAKAGVAAASPNDEIIDTLGSDVALKRGEPSVPSQVVVDDKYELLRVRVRDAFGLAQNGATRRRDWTWRSSLDSRRPRSA
jgi:hypothetical protein